MRHMGASVSNMNYLIETIEFQTIAFVYSDITSFKVGLMLELP